MQNEALPPPADQKGRDKRQEELKGQIIDPFENLAHLEGLALVHVIETQRSTFGSKVCPANEEEDDLDAPPDPDAPAPVLPLRNDAAARFAPSDSWRLPSDFVKYLAKKFEEEWTNPRTRKKEFRPLKHDQVLFVAQFAQVCDKVWGEDIKVEEGNLDVKKR